MKDGGKKKLALTGEGISWRGNGEKKVAERRSGGDSEGRQRR